MPESDTPSDDEILHRALELQSEDEAARDEAETREAQAEALAELGVSPEYLLRAEEELQRKALELSVARKAKRRKGLNLLLSLLILGVVASFAYVPPGPVAEGPWIETFERGHLDWELRVSPGSLAKRASVEDTTRGKVAGLSVMRFDAEQAKNGRYYVNLRLWNPPELLRGLRTMRIWVRGKGLKATRVYIRKDKSSRWRSPEIPLTQEWVQHTIPLNAFDYQERSGKKKWKMEDPEEITKVERIQIKVGYFINDVDARGSIYVDDLEFLP